MGPLGVVHAMIVAGARRATGAISGLAVVVSASGHRADLLVWLPLDVPRRAAQVDRFELVPPFG
jgi:hypothetical protein